MSDHVTDHLWFAGRVRRYHSWPTIQTQTIGEHSWQVAMVYEQIWGALNAGVERYIRLHDVAELVLGDIPFPVKSENHSLKIAYEAAEVEALKRMGVPPLPVLADTVKARIKACDLIEMMLYGMAERELGSMHAVPIIRRTRTAVLAITVKMPPDDAARVCLYIDRAAKRHEQVLNHRKED